MNQRYVQRILHEIQSVLSKVEDRQVKAFTAELFVARRIVVVGAGRVGMAARGFAMRLGHLGFKAYTLGDSTVPQVGRRDLVIICSGSGETQTMYDIAVVGKRNKARLVVITGNIDSRIAKLADVIVHIQAPSKTKAVRHIRTIQPMTTLNEQCLTIFFDALVLSLMKKMRETHNTMWARHSNLE